MRPMSAPELRVLLSNVRSSHNVGAIFRTADGAGVSKIYLGGYTPAPIDRYGRVVDEIKKTSLGATETVAWESVLDEEMFLQKIKDEEKTTWAEWWSNRRCHKLPRTETSFHNWCPHSSTR